MQNFIRPVYLMRTLLHLSTYFPNTPRIHHFKSDFINNMDHMRISGTEPSSVILSQTK